MLNCNKTYIFEYILQEHMYSHFIKTFKIPPLLISLLSITHVNGWFFLSNHFLICIAKTTDDAFFICYINLLLPLTANNILVLKYWFFVDLGLWVVGNGVISMVYCAITYINHICLQRLILMIIILKSR